MKSYSYGAGKSDDSNRRVNDDAARSKSKSLFQQFVEEKHSLEFAVWKRDRKYKQL